MVKTKDKSESAIRIPGPKGKRSIIPEGFQIRRVDNPMRMILDESEGINQPSETSQPPQSSLAAEPRLDVKTGQALQSGQDDLTSQVTETSQAPVLSGEWTVTSQVTETSQASVSHHERTRVDLMASLPDTKGFLRLYFQLIDHLYPQLDPFERAVHETLYRLSWGFNKPTCTISYQRIAERTGMSSKSAQRAVGRLENKGLIGKSSRVIGYQKEQGIEFSVVPPPRQVLESRQVKQTRQDLEALIIETDNTNKNIQIQAGVSASSRFSLEECRRYADHLKQTGQGITNPGGYATKIFRSGEADALIDAFLNLPTPIDIGKCPTCGGSNFVYIDTKDPDRGVKPCRHTELRNQST